MKIGEQIKKIRKGKGFSQKIFADICEISQAYLSQIENDRKLPNISVINTLSEKLHIPVACIMFLSIEQSDVKENKLGLYNTFKPTIDQLIKSIFLD